jgi:hypothetical protein
MSSVIEEILTSTIGFVIAMVILSVVIGVGLYGYWVYANHVTLENYLWPIAEVLPYQGGYLLAIVNTGNEPFTIEQVYLKGGTVITPSQAANPNLNWCSTSNTKLMHNQWWCGEVNQLPVAVRICSALDPQVCVVAPVHGWETVTFNQPSQAAFGISNCPVLVSVSDSQNAGWEVTWTMASGTYSVSESTSYQWCILPPYYPITIDFQSTITQSPSGYQCQISPSQAQVNYNGTPTTVPFTVTCQQSQSSPPGGGNNNNNYFVYVTVTGDSYGAGWEVSSGDYDITGNTNVNNEKLAIIGPGITIRAWITSNPSGYTCSISPGSYSNVQNGSTYTFTVNCVQGPSQPGTYGCLLTVQGQTNPSGIASVSVSPTSTFVPSGQTQTITATAPLQVGGNPWYEFDSWSGSVTSGPGQLSRISQGISGSNAYSTWQYTCPSGLTSNVAATVTITANYVYDYIDLVGPTVVSSSPVKYTLEWNVAPGSADQVSWSVSYGTTTFTVSATLYYTEYGKSLSGGSSLQATVYCSVGQPLITGASIIGPTTYVTSGSSGTNSVYVEVTWQCFVGRSPQ